MKAKLQIKQLRSVIGQNHMTRERMRGLGLSGVGTSVTVANTPSFRGAVKKVMHLITVEEV
jgi:large subunit ribosomal protein L30